MQYWYSFNNELINGLVLNQQQIIIVYYWFAMNKSTISNSSTFTYQAKTNRLKTQPSQFYQTLKTIESHRHNPETPSYMKIAVSKTHISLNRGYLDLKRKHKQKELFQERAQKGFEANKFIVFKNLHQFEVNIQSQKGIIQQKEESEKFYGLSTFKGTNKTVNTHQINLHVGEVSILSLFEGYDGTLSALTLKKKYPQYLLEYFKKRKSSERQASFPIIQNSIKYAIEKTQKQIYQLQQCMGDNSGSSLVSLVIHDGIIFAANCGQSSIYCKTIGSKLIRMAVPHTTKNSEEVDRIVRAGGRLYQTIVNVPFKTAMKVKGPLRIFPSGLTVTRTMGKSLQKSKQKAQINLKESGKGISSNPQIQYIPESEVEWIAIVSSKVDEYVKKERIQQIVEQEMAKRSTGYQGGEASEHICKRILLEAVESGATESVSALLITNPNRQLNQSQFARSKVDSKIVQDNQSSLSQNTPTLSHQPRSLKYIGNRKNFVEQVQIQ